MAQEMVHFHKYLGVCSNRSLQSFQIDAESLNLRTSLKVRFESKKKQSDKQLSIGAQNPKPSSMRNVYAVKTFDEMIRPERFS